MINRFLHALTNRKILSTSPVFLRDPDFSPAELSQNALRLREVLGLNAETDYYIAAYAAMIESHPDLKDVLSDPATSYSIYDFLPRGVVSTGATLVSNGDVSGVFADPTPTTLPLVLNYRISFLAAAVCEILKVESKETLTVNCQVVADDQNTWLRIDWPSSVPFTGLLRMTQPWVAGAIVNLEVSPGQFPFSLMVSQIKQNPYFSTLLQQFQAQETFHNTANPQDQLVLALAVIARGNPAAYPVA